MKIRKAPTVPGGESRVQVPGKRRLLPRTGSDACFEIENNFKADCFEDARRMGISKLYAQ